MSGPTTWFLAAYLIPQVKTGPSAPALKRKLGVSYPTGWLLHCKINRAMPRLESTHRSGGAVQLDNVDRAGEHAGVQGRTRL